MTTARLAGRVAIVTGASRGLGKAIAIALAQDGAAVAVAARSEQVSDERLPGTIHETAAAISAAGGRAVAVPCDVTQDDDLVRLVEQTRTTFGPIDLLVNNAALTLPARRPAAAPSGSEATPPTPATPPTSAVVLPMSVRGYRKHFEVGVFAAYRLSQLVASDLTELRRGAIVNISSDASRRPGPGPYADSGVPMLAAYGGNKAALEHLTQCVAYELAPYDVAVNALLPSRPVESPGLKGASPDIVDAEDPADFAEAVVQLSLVTPSTRTGQVMYHHDVLFPDRPARGWVG
jgi:NAD(P)-dependent dehydrogenase (short-subunit alcohol dehydrogenase family)